MNGAESSPAGPIPTPSAGPAIPPAPLLAARPAKVRDHHLDRKAIVSIRPSSPQQVAGHGESAARQYALADVAVAPGRPRDRVGTIGADQGRTGQAVEGRYGFQYILAELGLDHVGILSGRDASRLARSDPDWAPWSAPAACSAPCWATAMGSTIPPHPTTVRSWGSRAS